MNDYKEQIFSLLMKLNESVFEFKDSKLKHYGFDDLQACHGLFLGTLKKYQGEMALKDLTQKLNRSKSTVSAIADNLERKGYIEKTKNDHDNRSMNVKLTDKGHLICETFSVISSELSMKFLNDFSEEEVLILNLLLKRMLNSTS